MISQLLSPKTSRQVVGVSTVQTPTLVPPGPTPNLSLSKYSQRSSPGNQSTSHFHHMTYSQHATKRSETKHTSLQISIQADLLTVILAAYSPSEPTTHDPTVNLQLCMTIPDIQIQSFPTAMQTVHPSHKQRRPSRLPKELFLLSLPHFKL